MKAAAMKKTEPLVVIPLKNKIESQPDYSAMWFYDLVFESEKLLPQILGQQPRKRQIRVVDIQQSVARFYGIEIMDLISARRTGNIIGPRQTAVYLAKTLTTLSYPQIGRKFGDRDHTTMIHAYRKIRAIAQNDIKFRADLQAIAKDLGARLD